MTYHERKKVKLARYNRIIGSRIVLGRTWKEIAEQERISVCRIAQIRAWGQRISRERALEYTPLTSTDPDGVETAWAQLERRQHGKDHRQ